MTKLIFIRHAETDMAGTFCGHSDPELNARGLSQLPNLIDELKCWPIQEIYSSDLRRAQQTAQAIATHFQLECHVRKELREIHFGRWEGLRWNDIEMSEPKKAERWIQEYPKRDFPEGESNRAFVARVLKEVRFYMDKKGGGTLAVVTHAGFIRMALTRIFGMSDERAWDCTRKYGSVVPVDTSRVMEPHLVKEFA
jgi:alpha-ribazole phosphatase